MARTTIHFFPPCNSFFGGFLTETGRVTGRDAWKGFGAYADEETCFVLELAGTKLLPRNVGFLCVFISFVTFLSPM